MDRLKVYLDSCCLNRPFDDLTQSNILQEAEAVRKIMELAKAGKIISVSSQFVKYELESIKSQEKRDEVLSFYQCDIYHTLSERIVSLSKYYQTFKLKTFDSLHLATAESNDIDYLLTTDTDFIKYAKRLNLKTKIVNPCQFLKEEFNNAT